MPFVRIDLMRGKPAEYRKALGEIVYQAMIDVINVPKDDKFQVITEHAPEELNFQATWVIITVRTLSSSRLRLMPGGRLS